MLENYLRLLKAKELITNYNFIPLTDLGYDEEGDRLVITTEPRLTTARLVEQIMEKQGFNMEYRECGDGIYEMGFEF